MTWTKAAVEQRLIEAQRVLDSITPRPGIRQPRRATDVPVPSSYFGLEEVLAFDRARFEAHKLEGHFDPRTGERIKAVELRGRIPPENLAITRALEAWRWPVQYISDDRRRVAVQCFVVFKTARRHGFVRAVNGRLKRTFQGEVSKTSCYRLKDEGVGCIVTGLNAAGMPVVWEEAA